MRMELAWGRLRGLQPEQTVKGNAELQLAPEVDQTDQDRIGAVRNSVDRTRYSHLGNSLRRKCHPFAAEPEDQNTDQVAVAQVGPGTSLEVARLGRSGQPLRPLSQVALRGRPVEKGAGCRREYWTVATVDMRLELRTASIAGCPDPVPAIASGNRQACQPGIQAREPIAHLTALPS